MLQLPFIFSVAPYCSSFISKRLRDKADRDGMNLKQKSDVSADV